MNGGRTPRQLAVDADGTELVVFEWEGDGSTTVFLAHATGFHARCWDKVVDLLPRDWRVLALETRGHGRSQKHPPFVWARFVQDLLLCTRQLGVKQAIGVGHSMGGHCVAQAAASDQTLFERLVLVDPVIFEESHYLVEHEPIRPEDHPVSRRKGHFDSWREMYERFKDRHPYSLWRRDILEDYCRYGVVDNPRGGVDLACPGVVEAAVYVNNFSNNIHQWLDKISAPTVVLRAPSGSVNAVEQNFAASPTWPGLADAMPNARDFYLPHLTHFIPMQEPELVAAYIRGDVVDRKM